MSWPSARADTHASSINATKTSRYQNRSIETAQVMEELVEMAKKFRQAAHRGEELGLTEDEIRFYDALANNESAVRELTDETLKKIAHELTENLRKNITVDWSKRESVRASLRLMVKRILHKYKYPPDMADAAVELVLMQAETLGEEWSAYDADPAAYKEAAVDALDKANGLLIDKMASLRDAQS
jgi:hypothetical protein